MTIVKKHSGLFVVHVSGGQRGSLCWQGRYGGWNARFLRLLSGALCDQAFSLRPQVVCMPVQGLLAHSLSPVTP